MNIIIEIQVINTIHNQTIQDQDNQVVHPIQKQSAKRWEREFLMQYTIGCKKLVFTYITAIPQSKCVKH